LCCVSFADHGEEKNDGKSPRSKSPLMKKIYLAVAMSSSVNIDVDEDGADEQRNERRTTE
jgi:hypothetical protein